MSYATRNENGDNMGNTFVRCPTQDKARFNRNWDRIFGTKSEKLVKVWESDEHGEWGAGHSMSTSPPNEDDNGLIRKDSTHTMADDYNGLISK